MKAAGLLGLDLPADFQLPDPAAATAAAQEDPLDDEAPPDFALDFLSDVETNR